MEPIQPTLHYQCLLNDNWFADVYNATQCNRCMDATPYRVMLHRPRGLMDKASDFGSEDCEFESRRGQKGKFSGHT